MNVYELVPRFQTLFKGLDTAYGTGRGQWVKRPPRREDFVKHLLGQDSGIGIAPLMPDNHVWFAAIDLDEPDFDAAMAMQKFIPGESWIERSRSGNAHVWVFFKEPCPAWIAMGVLKEAHLAVGKEQVEVFPKNWDFQRVRFGNYINLPYHGKSRQVYFDPHMPESVFSLEEFLDRAEGSRSDPEKWAVRANWLQIHNPADRAELSTEWGSQARLHSCAERIISGDAGPIVEGTRNSVFFMLAKCLLNWQDCDTDEALEILRSVNTELCDPPEDDYELRRILGNVERARYTSTGCDDPLVAAYADPKCPIAHPRR